MISETQIEALDRTQPVLPITLAVTEQRTADYVRHGTTNLFAALNVGTGEVFGHCAPPATAPSSWRSSRKRSSRTRTRSYRAQRMVSGRRIDWRVMMPNQGLRSG